MAQELVVERRRAQQRVELGEHRCVVTEHVDNRGVLVAEQELDRAVLRRLESRRRAERRTEAFVFRRRQRLEHGPLLEELLLDQLDARENLERGLERIGAHVCDGRAQLVDHQLHPQLGDLMLDDEQHLVVPRRTLGRARQRMLRIEQPIETQVAAVREPIAQIGDNARLEFRHSQMLPSAPMSESTIRRALARTATAAVLALTLAACSDRALPERRIALTECRLPKVPQAVQCGRLEVPENRDQPDGAKLSVFVAVLPANTLSPKPDPLVLLAGGPGQAASTLGPFALQLSAIRRTRDIVLVDQRGSGRSAPLDCAAFAPDEHAEFDIDPVPKSLLCAWQLAGAPHRRGAIHDVGLCRRSRCRPPGARLLEAQPVGWQLRHARRAGIPAALSAARAQRRARRRGAAVDAHLVRRVANARRRARRRDRRLPRVGAVREGASRSGGDAARDRASARRRQDHHAARSAYRHHARDARRVRHGHRRAAAADLRAGGGEPDSRIARTCASRRLRATGRRVARRHRRPARSIQSRRCTIR